MLPFPLASVTLTPERQSTVLRVQALVVPPINARWFSPRPGLTLALIPGPRIIRFSPSRAKSDYPGPVYNPDEGAPSAFGLKQVHRYRLVTVNSH